MARMYSRKRGKSGSKRPVKRTKPAWLGYKPKEIEIIIAKLAKEGKSASQIGLILRDTYGIPDVRPILKKKITGILQEKKILPEIPEDLFALMKRSNALRKHFEVNKKDMVAKRGLQLTDAKIKRLIKYYKKIRKLPVGWKIDAKRIQYTT
ncbi:MAG TPA: 30S ribosomal protein S15 [Candidatus Nanoarchaeia archaeon]|nr:30S ribosomal protein S15 [Candidatus Nanoarchaeia archaeon]